MSYNIHFHYWNWRINCQKSTTIWTFIRLFIFMNRGNMVCQRSITIKISSTIFAASSWSFLSSFEGPSFDPEKIFILLNLFGLALLFPNESILRLERGTKKIGFSDQNSYQDSESVKSGRILWSYALILISEDIFSADIQSLTISFVFELIYILHKWSF